MGFPCLCEVLTLMFLLFSMFMESFFLPKCPLSAEERDASAGATGPSQQNSAASMDPRLVVSLLSLLCLLQ